MTAVDDLRIELAALLQSRKKVLAAGTRAGNFSMTVDEYAELRRCNLEFKRLIASTRENIQSRKGRLV